MTASRPTISRRRFVWSVGAGGLVLGSATARPSLAQGKRRLRYVSFAGKTSTWSTPYAELARQMDQRSGGELQLDWVGGPEVVGPMQAGDAITKGVFDIAHSAGSYYASAVPEAVSMSSGRASQDSIYASGVFDELDRIHQKKMNVILLSIASSGIGYIFMAREQPRDLAFFAGKKFRSIPLFDPVLTSLRAAPVTIAPNEVYAALERGVVDGIGWPEVTIKEYGFHDRAKFLMRPAFYTSRTPHLMNRQAFERLPQPLQVVLRESARAAGQWADKQYRETAAAELTEMKAKGLVEVALSPDEAQRFLKLTEDTLWQQISAQAPDSAPRLRELFSKAESMG